jgi:hypothetical protein
MFQGLILVALVVTVILLLSALVYSVAETYGRLKVRQSKHLMEYKLDSIVNFVLASMLKEALKLQESDTLRVWSNCIKHEGGHYTITCVGDASSDEAVRNSSAPTEVKNFIYASLTLLDEIRQEAWLVNGHFDPFVTYVNNRQQIFVNHREIISAYRAIMTCTTAKGVDGIQHAMINILLK